MSCGTFYTNNFFRTPTYYIFYNNSIIQIHAHCTHFKTNSSKSTYTERI